MFQYATVILPIVTVLVSTILSRFRPSEKWTACCVAAAEIVAEIYMYRTRGGDYDDANFIHESSTGKVGHAIHQPWRALESPNTRHHARRWGWELRHRARGRCLRRAYRSSTAARFCQRWPRAARWR